MTRPLACAALLVLSAPACANPVGPHPITAESIRQARSPEQLTAATADVVIAAPEGTHAVRVGQTVGLQPVRDGIRWQVSFPETALELLTPPERLAEPGPDGWVWKALAPGVIEITLTSTAPCAAPPCGPNVMQFTITLEIAGAR